MENIARENSKIIRVSKKRQITIPLDFYNDLKIGNEIECSIKDGKIIIQPFHRVDNEFYLEILKDLVRQGLSGDELIKEYENQSYKINQAISNLKEEAESIATGEKSSASLEDIFPTEN